MCENKKDIQIANERIKHINRVLRAIRNVNKLIVSETDNHLFIQKACQALTENLGYFNAWIALLDEKESDVRMTASSGFNGGFRELQDRLCQGHFTSCMRETLRQNQPMVIAEPPTNCPDCPLASTYSGRSGMTSPISLAGRTYGILSVSVPLEYAYDEEEQKLFKEIAYDLGFAFKRMETEEQRHRLNQIVSTIPQPTSFVSKDYKYLAVNDAYADFYGAATDQIVGKTVAEFCGFSTFEEEIKPHLDRCLNGEEIRYEVLVDFPGKGSRWMEMDYIPFVGVDKTITGVISHGFDISDRKRIEESLKTSEEKWRYILVDTPQIGIALDPQANIVFANKRFLELTGWEEREIIGQNWFDYFIPEEVRQEVRNVFATVMNSQSTARFSTFENVIMTSRGERLNVAWSNVLTKDSRGHVTDVTCLGIDLTERKKAEDALRVRETRFNKMLGVIPDMISIHDPEMNIVYSNWQGFASVPESKRLTQTKCYHTYRGFNDVCPDCQAQRVIDTGEAFQEEFQLPDGTWVDLRVIPLVDEAGQVDLFMEWVRDITEAKQAEEHRARLQEQLQQAQKMEAIGTLTGGISHDFNNLLQAINGYTQLLLMDKPEDDPEYHSLTAIQNAGKRAADLVRSLLLFSRKAETERIPMELNIEVERARTILERTIPKMVEIDVYPGRRLWTIMADPVQIEQILLNLGSNAADAMPDGGKLTIETANITLEDDFVQKHLGAQPGRYVLMTISDTGQGMDRETQKKIFEPFFTTKEFGKGTGLGLASVYGIVQSHGGYINCYSEEGQGTTFKIYFPAVVQPEIQVTKELESSPIPKGNETILLVDDEEAIRGFAEQTLMKFGYKVMTASSGEKALEVYRDKSKEIDLVITDIGMPGMGGHKFLQELLQVNPMAKVLIASGYSINGRVKQSMEAGARGYVGKPYQLIDLLVSVRKILDGKE